MKSRILLIVSILYLVLAFSGCSILKGPVLEALFPEPESPATGIPDELTSEVDDDETPVVRDGVATVEVVNQSDYSICYVYVTSSDDDYWGDSILERSEEIAPGDSYSFELPEGVQDVLAQTCDEETVASKWELNQSATITVGGDGLVPVVIDNQSKLEICYLYVADTDAEYWEEDSLGQWETIVPWGGKRIIFVEPGVYDFLASDCDDQDIFWDNEISVDETTEWVVDMNADLPDHQYDYGGLDMTIILNNDTDMDWCYVYISPGDADTWGTDWLKPAETLDAGDMKPFSLVAGEYDVSVTDCNNSVVLTAWGVTDNVTLEVSVDDKVPLRVINWHDEDICYAYLDEQGSSEVGESWLPGWEVIYGYSGKRTFYVTPGVYDLTYEDCSGTILDQASGVELYEESSWIVGLEE